ncbi:unnamed protein product [Phytophthora fragariaefolia]|uniref:Unnamed protein product n=1 Tax=Phytophthora fragariaefolia TaxID=1490495 RepID=A0A9W6XPB8_9STRA|nr:unnamed protein product [Phytophthora fragariaefolia]
MTRKYQAVEKARRASEHNDSPSRQEKASLPRPRVNENSESNPEDADDTCTPVDESPFYLVVHVCHLKAVKEFGDRPKVRLTGELTDEARLDIDEELLPEDSWEPNLLAGEYEVKFILDDRRPTETSTRRSVREFQVKWVGYDEPTWEPMTNLSCGGLLYDYLREKRSSQRFQIVPVADED